MCYHLLLCLSLFFFNYPATTQIYTLSLHDALPIYFRLQDLFIWLTMRRQGHKFHVYDFEMDYRDSANQETKLRFYMVNLSLRSEEHTSELQSLTNLVCRLLLEKKKKKKTTSQEHKL